MRHRTILLIDDSQSDRDVLRQYLLADSDISYTIIESNSAAAGLAVCRQQLPDGILLEIKLPDFDGFEFLSQLKAQTSEICPPVIVVSCDHDAVTAAKAFKNGVEDYFVKGRTTPDDVRLAMRCAIENTELRRQPQHSEDWILSGRTWDGQGNPVRAVGSISDISDISEQRNAALRERKQGLFKEQEQTKLLQVIVDSIGDGLILANSDGEFVIFNRAAQEIFGSLSNERSPKEWSSTYGIYLPDQQTLFPAAELPLAKAIRGEYVTDVEMFVRRVQTEEGRWISISGFPVVDISSEITGGVITCRDITERKIAEVALRQSQERYRILAESIPQFVFITSADGKNEFVNQQFCNYTGLSVEQLLQLDWLTIIHPDDVERTQERWMMSVNTGCLYEIEYRFRHADGTYRWFLGQGVPMKDEQGCILKWIGTCTDIDQQKQLDTERIRLLEKEQAAREAAEKANRIKDEFLAVLSHELRTPLNPILGWSKLLQTGNLDPIRTSMALATIERNAKLQSQLIEDLLDVSRILQGKLSLNVTAVNLATTIASALETVRLAAETKNIEIQVFCAPNVDQISGDAGRLQQIVWNLLSNAVKFTPQGGRVEVQLTQVKDHAQIQVMDTGKGILPDFLPDVFEHFRQEDGATTRKFGGLGLGLAIVRQLVELHGGTVVAESPGEGQGATFTVRIPTIPTIEMIPHSKISTQSLDLSGLQILVVDDEPDSRDFVAFVLEEAGATVFSLSSAIEALKIFSLLKIDILVSDIGMPEMDGYMLMQEMRARVDSKGIPAIALTAYALEIDQQQAKEAGFQHHLSKPVDPEKLVEIVAQLAQRLH